MIPCLLLLFPAARPGFPEAADVHHFGSSENPKYPHCHDYVSDYLVSKHGSGVYKHKSR